MKTIQERNKIAIKKQTKAVEAAKMAWDLAYEAYKDAAMLADAAFNRNDPNAELLVSNAETACRTMSTLREAYEFALCGLIVTKAIE